MKKIKQLLQPAAKKASSTTTTTNFLTSDRGEKGEEEAEGINLLSNGEVREEILRATKDGYPARRVFWAGFKSVPGICNFSIKELVKSIMLS